VYDPASLGYNGIVYVLEPVLNFIAHHQSSLNFIEDLEEALALDIGFGLFPIDVVLIEKVLYQLFGSGFFVLRIKLYLVIRLLAIDPIICAEV
jgi:hypothetical protein